MNSDYEKIQPSLCLERAVAAEVFNTTCSYPTERPSSYSPLINVVIVICALAFLIMLVIIICCVCKPIKRLKTRKILETAEFQTNGRNSEREEGSPSSGKPNMNVNPQGGRYFPLSNGQHIDENSEEGEQTNKQRQPHLLMDDALIGLQGEKLPHFPVS